MESRAKRLSREWLYIELVTLAVWWITYIPLGFILGFDMRQWEIWFSVGTVYDIIAAYPVSKAVIILYEFAKGRGWFGAPAGTESAPAKS